MPFSLKKEGLWDSTAGKNLTEVLGGPVERGATMQETITNVRIRIAQRYELIRRAALKGEITPAEKASLHIA